MAVLPYQGLYVGFPMIFNPIGAIPPPETNFTRNTCGSRNLIKRPKNVKTLALQIHGSVSKPVTPW